MAAINALTTNEVRILRALRDGPKSVALLTAEFGWEWHPVIIRAEKLARRGLLKVVDGGESAGMMILDATPRGLHALYAADYAAFGRFADLPDP